MRVAINGVIIEDKKILLVKKKNHWILPGGKPKSAEESDYDCLDREVLEETGLELLSTVWYNRFEGRTPNTGDVLEARVYFATIIGTPTPKAEITDIA